MSGAALAFLPLVSLIVTFAFVSVSDVLRYHVSLGTSALRASVFDAVGVGKAHNTLTGNENVDLIHHSTPFYVLNLERSKTRLDYMRQMFQTYMKDEKFEFIPVKAIDYKNDTHMARYLGVDRADMAKHISTICEPNTSPAQLFSFFKAMAIAYKQNRTYAVLVDDDISFEFVPHWTKSISQIAEEVSAKDPDWEIVRLGYTIGEHGGNGGRTAYMVLQEWKSMYPNLPAVMRWHSNMTAFSSGSQASGSVYGSHATMYSFKALERFALRHVNFNQPPAPDAKDLGEHFTNAFGVDHFAATGTCVTDRYLRRIKLNDYIATPPLFTYRLAEGSHGHRTGKQMSVNEHVNNHLRARSFAEQFVAEALELLHSSPKAIPAYKWERELASAGEISALQVQGEEPPRLSKWDFLGVFHQNCVLRFNTLICEPKSYPSFRDFRLTDS